MSEELNNSSLRNFITEHFSLEDTRTLCGDCGVDYEELSHTNKESLVRELIRELARTGKISELVHQVQRRRPELFAERFGSQLSSDMHPTASETANPVPQPTASLSDSTTNEGGETDNSFVSSQYLLPFVLVVVVIAALGAVTIFGRSSNQSSETFSGMHGFTLSLIAIIAGVVLGVFSNRLYDILRDRGVFQERPTLKRFLVVVVFFIPVVILVALPEWADGLFIESSACEINASGLSLEKSVVEMGESIDVSIRVDNPDGRALLFDWQAVNGKMDPELGTNERQSSYTAPAKVLDDTISVNITMPGCENVTYSKQIAVIRPEPTPTHTAVLTPVSALKPTLTHTATPIPTSTPVTDQILILIANFRDESETVTYDAAARIKRALETSLEAYDLPNVEIECIDQTFGGTEGERVEALGKERQATIFIWGYYDSAGMVPDFKILSEDVPDVLPESPQERIVNLSNPPDDFAFYISRELPSEMTYFTQFTIAQIFFTEKMYSETLELLEDAIKSAQDVLSSAKADIDKTQKNLAVMYLYKGFIHNEVYGNPNQAIQDYSQAIEFNPDFVDAYLFRGIVHYNSNELERATEDFTAALEADPVNRNAILARGHTYYVSGNLTQAAEDFERIAEVNPTDTEALNSLCWVGSLDGQAATVMPACEKVVLLSPENGGFRDSRGLARALIGDYEGAIEDFRFFLQWSEKYDTLQPHRPKREEWISQLEKGINPFDESTLADLQNEYMEWPP